MMREAALLQRLYDRFNARDIEAVLATLHDDVQWANGWEGGYVAGREGVRQYWLRQWESIDPHVAPVGSRPDHRARSSPRSTRSCATCDGKLLADKVVQHVFRIQDGRIKRFDIGTETN
jgi:ketosteroid isomerase-like protein